MASSWKAAGLGDFVEGGRGPEFLFFPAEQVLAARKAQREEFVLTEKKPVDDPLRPKQFRTCWPAALAVTAKDAADYVSPTDLHTFLHYPQKDRSVPGKLVARWA